jgi:hypothetical protein
MKKKLNQTPSGKLLRTLEITLLKIQDDATNAMSLAILQAHVPTNLHHHNKHIEPQLTNAYLACQQKQKITKNQKWEEMIMMAVRDAPIIWNTRPK